MLTDYDGIHDGVPVLWIEAVDTAQTSFSTKYVAYGIEASLESVCNQVYLVVRVKPPDERAPGHVNGTQNLVGFS